ncbi:MAG: HTH domain-containing protein [Treponemataceae bacterium]|nr:HTH domain-containing protein [Treponemataceae bacterium]
MSDKKDLLVLLKDKSPRTASELAAALDVTSRTIYRWVEKLAEEGFAIYSTAGRAGGVYLGNPEDQVVSSDSDDDAEKVVNAVKSTKTENPKPKSPKTKKASEKKSEVKEVKIETKVEVEQVYVDWLEVSFSPEEIELKIDKKFIVCKEAILTKHVLNFTYHLPQGKMLICSTEPVKFFYHENEWHILAWVRQVEKFKVFQLLNMTDLMIGPEKHNRTADFSIQEAMKK